MASECNFRSNLIINCNTTTVARVQQTEDSLFHKIPYFIISEPAVEFFAETES